MDRAKPFDIPKREVWEAYKRVKANQGAAGVDGQSIADFEADLSNNLYKLWNRMSSGSYFPPPVRRVDIPKGEREGRGRWGFQRSPIESPRWWSNGIWSRWWSLCSSRLLWISARQIGARCGRAWRGSDAGATTGCLISTSRASLTASTTNLLMRAVRKHTECPWVLLYIETMAESARADGGW